MIEMPNEILEELKKIADEISVEDIEKLKTLTKKQLNNDMHDWQHLGAQVLKNNPLLAMGLTTIVFNDERTEQEKVFILAEVIRNFVGYYETRFLALEKQIDALANLVIDKI